MLQRQHNILTDMAISIWLLCLYYYMNSLYSRINYDNLLWSHVYHSKTFILSSENCAVYVYRVPERPSPLRRGGSRSYDSLVEMSVFMRLISLFPSAKRDYVYECITNSFVIYGCGSKYNNVLGYSGAHLLQGVESY